MNKIRVFSAAAALSSLLMLGSPAVISADVVNKMPPAVVFVQDENERMLAYHNFAGDNGLLIPWESDVDKGFWVEP